MSFIWKIKDKRLEKAAAQVVSKVSRRHFIKGSMALGAGFAIGPRRALLYGGPSTGGGLVEGVDSSFIASGCTTPYYTTTSYNAIYDPNTDRTYVTWEAFNRFKREIRVKYRFHDTANKVGSDREGPGAFWSQDYYISDNTLADDDHGVPAIEIDGDGYLWVFGGAHPDPADIGLSTDKGVMKWWRSNSVNDPSAWTQQASLDLKGRFTYPHPVIIGSTLYLFMRGNGNTVLGFLTLLKGSISAGVCTMGSPKNLVDFSVGGTSNRFYPGNFVANAAKTKIYFTAAFSDDADTIRRDVYGAIFDVATEALSNVPATRTDAVAAQPVNLTNFKTYYRVIDHETGGFVGTTPFNLLDQNENPHYFYTEVLDGSSGGSIKHRYWNGSAFSSPATIASLPAGLLHHYDGSAAVLNPDNSITAQFVAGTSSFNRDGDQYRANWTSGGGWAAPALLMSSAAAKYSAETEYALGNAVVVRNGHPALRFLWQQHNEDKTAEVGLLRIFGSGADIASPLIGTRWSPDTDSILKRMPTEPSLANAKNINDYIMGMRSDGVWTDMYQFWVTYAHSSAAALIPWRSNRFPLTITGSPVFTAYGGFTFVSGGYLSTGMPANQLPDTNFSIGGVFDPNTSGSALAGCEVTATNLNAAMTSTTVAFNRSASAGQISFSQSSTGFHFMAGQRSGTTQSLNYDGSAVGTPTTATNAASTSESILFGRRFGASSGAKMAMGFISLAIANPTFCAALKTRTQAYMNAVNPGAW